MAKLTLNSILSGYGSVTEYNANNALIEAALENTLSRDGTTPNTMSADLDLNSNDLNNATNVNAGNVITTSLTLNGQSVSLTDTLTGGLDATEVTYDPTGPATATTLQAALDSDYLRNDEDGTLSGTLTSNLYVFNSERASADGSGTSRIGRAPNASNPFDSVISDNIEFDGATNDYGYTGDGVCMIGMQTRATDGEMILAVGPDGVAAGTNFTGTEVDAAQLRISSGLSPAAVFTMDGSERFRVTGSGVTLTGTLNLANASSGQITFPATANLSSNVNTLDDYEEGTWTPSLGGTTTYNVQQGSYQKIGNRVFVSCHLNIGTIGTGTTANIAGLPFTAGENTGFSIGGYLLNTATSVVDVGGLVASGSSNIQLWSRAAAATTATQAAIFGNNTTLLLNFSYKVNV